MPAWYVIRNPVSGNGKGQRHWPAIQKALGNHFEMEAVSTERPWHAGELAFEAYGRGKRHFILCGGDGTLHETVNGLARHGFETLKECVIGVVPIGTGNDWSKTMGLGGSYTEVAGWLSQRCLVHQDLMEVSWTDDGGIDQNRLAVNMVGAGFDSFVANQVNRLIRKKNGIGRWTYLYQLAKSLFLYRPGNVHLTADDLEIEELLYTIAIGNGQFNGGGMKQCPEANPTDGILDLMIARAISRFTVVRKLPGVFSGSFVNHPKVSTHRTKSVTLSGPWQIEADGESLGTLPATVRIIPSALPVLVHPKKPDQWSFAQSSSSHSYPLAP